MEKQQDGFWTISPLRRLFPVSTITRWSSTSTRSAIRILTPSRRKGRYRLGGVCLLAVPAEPGAGQSGISVSWTTHDLLLRDQRRYRIYRDAHQAMNAALGRVLAAFGYQVAPFGSGGAWLVTGRRSRGTGAGQ